MLSVQRVSISHRLQNFSVTMRAGECWHVFGQNGAGKSSLFDVISGLLKADSGDITIHGQAITTMAISDIAKKLVYLQQQYTLSFALKVKEVLHFYTGVDTVPEVLDDALSISSLLNKNVNNLSGGEQQRVHIARCLMQAWPTIEQGQSLVLLDEPIQSLDVVYQEKALRLFQNLAKKGNLLVLSIHDVNLSMRYCDHVLMIKNNI